MDPPSIILVEGDGMPTTTFQYLANFCNILLVFVSRTDFAFTCSRKQILLQLFTCTFMKCMPCVTESSHMHKNTLHKNMNSILISCIHVAY